MAQQPKRERPKTYTSPRGEFLWPKLNEPDYGTEDYPCPEGRYSVKLVLGAAEAKALKATLNPLHQEAIRVGQEEHAKLPVAARKKTPFKVVDYFTPEYDEDEQETGRVIFNFKMTASGVIKKNNTEKPWSRKPALFDAKGQPYSPAPEIWNGTIGRVSFQAIPFFKAAVGAGLSLRLEAAQVIELRSGSMRTAESYGFGNEAGDEDEDTGSEAETTPSADEAGGEPEEF